jgi:hypothetical protein
VLDRAEAVGFDVLSRRVGLRPWDWPRVVAGAR